MKEFEQGKKIMTVSGDYLEIDKKLGEGGQGVVYRVNYQGRPLALKWYFGNKLSNPNIFYDNILNNIKSGAPTSAFLWPMELTRNPFNTKNKPADLTEDSYGYLMELRPQEYKEFSQFLLAKVRFSSLKAIANAALNIVNGFRELHAKGYSYQDLNDGNFFVNPVNGDVLICDNDNVAPYGKALGIAGKCRYMAPEVVMGKKLPDSHTDRFSLAVVLYLLLFLNHPLEGKATLCPCLTEELERKFYGTDPIFVYDSTNDTNRPVRGVHSNEIKLWPLYPRFVREAFQKAFSREAMVGRDATHRMTERDWQKIFVSLRDSICRCPSCGEETYTEAEDPTYKCINCGHEFKRLPVLNVKKYSVVLSAGQKVYECHTDTDSSDFWKETGEVVASKMNPAALGLRNNSGKDWQAVLPNGNSKVFHTGEVIKIGAGITIKFGNRNDAEIV